jgi:hypothetical protein
MKSTVHIAGPWDTVASTPAAPVEVQTIQPARAASVASDVWVPLLQSVASGIFVGGIAALIAQDIKVWPVAALVVASLAWVLLLFDSRRLLWALERWTNHDFDKDGFRGQPTHTEHVKATLEDESGQPLPGGIDTEALGWNRNGAIMFCRATLQIGDFTEGRWGRTNAFGNSITSYRRIRGELEGMGYLERTGEASNATWALTRAGRAIFSKIAALPFSG